MKELLEAMEAMMVTLRKLNEITEHQQNQIVILSTMLKDHERRLSQCEIPTPRQGTVDERQ